MKALLPIVTILLSPALPLYGQADAGELRLQVIDPAGRPLHTALELRSLAAAIDLHLSTDDTGHVTARALPFGRYAVLLREPGFAPVEHAVELRSAVPENLTLRLQPAQVQVQVQVSAATLVDPHQAAMPDQIGRATVAQRLTALPGRSIQDLVNSQPGWLYEGNAVLHPRGSEYQTQFVVDGVPLTDNRSPGFGPEIAADDVESLRIYTAGFPAEYGRKLGGVVELESRRSDNAGLHGQLVLSGGSYDTAAAYGRLQLTHGADTLAASSSGSMTSHYLNPVVPQNFTNQGTTGDFALRYDRELSQADRLTLSLRHGFSRFQIPNELLQQQAGQAQNGNNVETMGAAAYQHIFSAAAVLDLSGMVRDDADGLNANALSTPIIAFQQNSFREGYFKSALSFHQPHQEWKIGLESDTTLLHEHFSDSITDPTQFDAGTPAAFAFAGSRPDLEEAAFVEDLLRLGDWTLSAGLRYDHYQLLLNRSAFSPRIALGRYLPALRMLLHASYDRVFQTPSSENILISSSPLIVSLDPEVLRLPVEPSTGNYYEGGLTRGFDDWLRADLNVYRRDVRNYADDDQLLNTGVSYPISFRKAVIYGAEAKLTLVDHRGFSGFASYSYMVGNSWLPVTGGLLLGDDVAEATAQLGSHFPDSQDQRNTLRTLTRYQAWPRVALSAGVASGSGLPFAFTGTEQDALAEYGHSVVSRVNFDRGRVRPNLSVDASLDAALYQGERGRITLQVDGENLNNRLNVLDFGGLFSGNAIAPGRSYGLRLTSSF